MHIDLETRIRERAYALWEQEGRFDGRAHDHWRRAEREMAATAAAFAKPAEAITPKRRATAAKASVAAARTKRAKAQVLHS